MIRPERTVSKWSEHVMTHARNVKMAKPAWNIRAVTARSVYTTAKGVAFFGALPDGA